MFCNKCGTSNNSPINDRICSVCGAIYPFNDADKHLSPSISWENFELNGIFFSFIITIKNVLFSPYHFFSALSHKNDTLKAWLFALMAGSVGLLADYVWQYILPIIELPFFPPLQTPVSAVNYKLILSPLILSVELGIISLYIYTMLKLTRYKPRLNEVFVVVCYTQSIALLSIIPWIGTTISSLWAIYILTTAFSARLQTSRLKVAFALVLPLIFLMLLIAILIITTLGSGILLSVWFKELVTLFR